MRGPVIYSHTQPEARRLIPSTSPLLSNRYIERVSGCSVPGGVDRNASAHTHAAAAAAASPAIAGAGAGAGAAPAASSTLLPALAHIIIPAGKAHGLQPTRGARILLYLYCAHYSLLISSREAALT